MKVIRPPVKWHGGKHYLAARIAAMMPPHETYGEPFGGAASVLLNKEPSPVEVYNDLHPGLTNLFWVIRNHPDELRTALALTPYSEVEFNNCRTVARDASPIEKARRFYVLCRQSIGGRATAFSKTIHRVRGDMADVVSAWLSSIDENLPAVINRFRSVQVTGADALLFMTAFDSFQTLYYLDPPYLPETVVTPDAYEYGMTREQHIAMLNHVIALRAKVMLSGYPSALYAERLKGWKVIEYDMANHSATGEAKQRKTEVIWANFNVVGA